MNYPYHSNANTSAPHFRGAWSPLFDDLLVQRNLSKYVWSLDIPTLFYRTIWAFAVKQARSLPDVFVVPVALWKWSFSQMEYFHSVYIPLERVFPTSDWTSTVNHRNVWLSETRCHHVIKKWIIHITQMQTHRLRISEAHEVRCLMIF